MGTQVTATADSNTKPNYTVATVLVASIAVADGEFAVWVGATISDQVVAFDGIRMCKQALRELGWPNPLTLAVSEAIYDTQLQAFTVTATEDCVAVIQGFDFTPAGKSNSAHSARMAELWLESTAKAA